MKKKKNRKKKDKKIAEKAKTLKAKLKEKAKKEKAKVKLKEKARKEKTKVKQTKTKGMNAETAASPVTSKEKRGTPGKAVSIAKTPGASSLSVNARTAISKIRSLGKIEAINYYIAGDKRVTVRKAATSKITSLSGK
jgi:hypothetical protein